MNLYILVEGKSEKYIYPAWLEVLIPGLSRVEKYDEADEYNYYLFSSFGYPSILDDIISAIDEINEVNKYDYLMIVLDADDTSVEDRRTEVLQKISETTFSHSRVLVVVQNHSIETWCLGNRKVYSRNPTTDEFISCTKFYCVKDNDPEYMGIDESIMQVTTTAQYHEYYLRKMLLERNASYSKGKRSKAVQDVEYLKQLIERIETTNHLDSFKEFILLTQNLKQQIETRKSAAPGIEEDQ